MSIWNAVLLAAALGSPAPAPAAPAGAPGPIEVWLTRADRSALCARQPATVPFGDEAGYGPAIVVDDAQSFQTMDGFGYALTGGSAELLMKMTPTARADPAPTLRPGRPGIRVSYLRVTHRGLGLNSIVFSYDDLPRARPTAARALRSRRGPRGRVPVLNEMLALTPDLKILGSPWSAPAWMKTNQQRPRRRAQARVLPGLRTLPGEVH